MIRKEYARRYYLANKESINRKAKIYRDTHKDKVVARHKKYCKNNREKINAYQRKYFTKNKEKVRKQIRNANLQREFGITNEIYDELFVQQGGVCAICGSPETSKIYGKIKHLAVDHCHKTNMVRKLLCQNCNLALGYVKDDIVILTKMIVYLKGL